MKLLNRVATMAVAILTVATLVAQAVQAQSTAPSALAAP